MGHWTVSKEEATSHRPMSSPPPQKPLGPTELHGPAADFAKYCEAEFERRGNSDDPFDEDLYRDAMELVVRRLNRSGSKD